MFRLSWEHMILTFDGDKNVYDGEEILNIYVDNGWQLVAVIQREQELVFFLKRRKTKETD